MSVEKVEKFFNMEPVMVSEEALTLLWDPGSLIGALEVKPVEIERLESSTGLKLLEKLVVAPELSLRCNFFKFLPVPAVGVLSEKPERVAEMVIGALLLIVKCSQPSATDFIYLDWHFSQGNSCNDQRCFQLRSHRLCEAPVKIASQIQSSTLEPLNVAPEPAPAATTTGSGAVFSLEVAPEEHEASSGRLGDDLGLRRQKNVSGVKPVDALPPYDDQRRKNVHHLPGDGFRRESLNLGDAFPRADHRREENGLPRSGVKLAGDDRRQENAFVCSGLELNDALPKDDDLRGKGNAFLHSGLRMNDTLPKDDDLQGGFPRSGVKLADAFPKAGDHQRQENAFLRSGLGLNDPLPKPDEHLRQENAFLRSELGLNNPLPKPDDHLRQDNDFLLSGMGLNDSLPKSDDHLRQKNTFLRSELGLNDGLPKAGDHAFLRSGLKPGDRFAKADDHRSGSKPGDPLPKADDHRRQSSLSGAKLADPFDDHQLRSNGFSGMRFDDASPSAEDHQHEKSVSTRGGVNKASGASPPSTCSAIFVANISLVNKQGLTSRRSTYQKVLSFEKNGAQVIERELRLPIDLILSPKECLVFYTPERLGLQGQAWSSEAVSSCIVSIIDNEMKAISFGFQVCFMVFEGDRKFISAVLEDLDTIYVAAVGLNIHAQCFVASSPGETEEVVSRCLKQAQGSFNFNSSGSSSALPRMAESQTVAEAFLTQSPAINPLTAHAILSSGKPLSTFISMQTMEQLQACRPFIVSKRSLELFKAQCEFGMVEPAQKRAHLQSQEHFKLKKALESVKKRASAGESLKRRQQTLESEKKRAFAGESLKRRQQTLEDVLPTQSTSKQMFTQRFEFEEVQGPEQDGFSPEEEQQVELSAPYFPPAAELNEEWSPEMKFSSGPYFPPAAQLDEVWDESPAVAEQQQQQQQKSGVSSFDYFSEKNFESENEFGFSSNNRRQSSSSSSVKDALKSWLSTREKNKQSLKKPPLEEQRSINMNNNNNMQMPGLGNCGRKREAAAPLMKEEGNNKGSRKKQQQQVKKNDILSLWENFKCRKQAQIQASGSLLQTSRSFKRPSSSIFSSSSSSPQREQQPQKSFSSVAQQPRGGKRAKRITL